MSSLGNLQLSTTYSLREDFNKSEASKTMYEGILARVHLIGYAKKLCRLGCGVGFLSGRRQFRTWALLSLTFRTSAVEKLCSPKAR